jgi:hypothetical protein
MKKPPEESKLEDILHSSRLVAGGFMGSDTRSVIEIIEADAAELLRLGITAKQVAERLQEITNIAKTALGTWILVDDERRAQVDEARGFLICPWGHLRKCDKRVTTVAHIKSGQTARWSDLNIHLISEHGFFEGNGSAFRLDPERLVKIIF